MFAQLTPQQLADFLEQVKSSQGITPEYLSELTDEIFGNTDKSDEPAKPFYGAIAVRYKDSRTPGDIAMYDSGEEMEKAANLFKQNHLLAEIVVFTNPDRYIRPKSPEWVFAE